MAAQAFWCEAKVVRLKATCDSVERNKGRSTGYGRRVGKSLSRSTLSERSRAGDRGRTQRSPNRDAVAHTALPCAVKPDTDRQQRQSRPAKEAEARRSNTNTSKKRRRYVVVNVEIDVEVESWFLREAGRRAFSAASNRTMATAVRTRGSRAAMRGFPDLRRMTHGAQLTAHEARRTKHNARLPWL